MISECVYVLLINTLLDPWKVTVFIGAFNLLTWKQYYVDSEQRFSFNWHEEDGRWTWSWWALLSSCKAHVQLGQDEAPGVENVPCCVHCFQHWCCSSCVCCHFPAKENSFCLGSSFTSICNKVDLGILD